MGNCELCNEDVVDNDGSDDVIVVPEVVSVNSVDVTATVGCRLVVGASVSGPVLVMCSTHEVVGNCVLFDEISDVIRDVTEDVVVTEVVEDVLVSVVSWNPK